MITCRDIVADAYRRQDMMQCAEQHRLVQTIMGERARKPNYWRRSLSRLGQQLVNLGQRLQAQTIGQNQPPSPGEFTA